METFVIPLCDEVSANKRYDEKGYVAQIENEIKRLDLLKLNSRKTNGRKGSTLPIDIANNKCVAKNCSYKGLNSNNKSAVGVCANCGNCEHFGCVKISGEDREDILNGAMKYFCSSCFSKNPSIAINSSKTPSLAINSAGVSKQAKSCTPSHVHSKVFFSPISSVPPLSVENSSTAAVPTLNHLNGIVHIPISMDSSYNCTLCTLTSASKDQLEEHMKDVHGHECLICDIKEKTKEDLDLHIKKNHSFPCEYCENKSATELEAKEHIQKNHSHPCSIFDETFTEKGVLAKHLIDEHSIKCQVCEEKLGNNSELQKHIKEKHSFICNTCGEKFNSKDQMNNHSIEKHAATESEEQAEENLHPCFICKDTFMEKELLTKHIIDEHSTICEVCDDKLGNNSDLQKHINEKHSFHCGNWTEKFDSEDKLKDHKVAEHTLSCRNCDEKFCEQEEFMRHETAAHKIQCTWENCEVVLETQALLDIHIKTNHSQFECILCTVKFCNKDELNFHIEAEHSMPCGICKKKFTKSTELAAHKKTHNRYSCTLCSFTSDSQKNLKEHCDAEHTFTCLFCTFMGVGEETMEEHILEKHAETDTDSFYNCEYCSFKSKDKEGFGKHFKDIHKSNHKKKDNTEGLNEEDKSPSDENKELKEEIKVLKSNFERLQLMYHQSLDEVNKVKSEYEAKVMVANDSYRVVKTENEVLKERVDVLFKLGRSYLNNSETKKKEAAEDIEEEIIEADKTEDAEDLENLEEWTKNKLRGFRRVDPTKPSNKQTKNSSTKAKTTAEVHPPPPQSKAPPKEATPKTSNGTENFEREENNYKGRYCHYFVNVGNCTFEERTGIKCKYEHKQAPMCNQGTSCTRVKCMYSHPKLQGNRNQNNFLGQTMNPWAMMNTWMNQTPNPWNAPNPWNKTQGSQNANQ